MAAAALPLSTATSLIPADCREVPAEVAFFCWTERCGAAAAVSDEKESDRLRRRLRRLRRLRLRRRRRCRWKHLKHLIGIYSGRRAYRRWSKAWSQVEQWDFENNRFHRDANISCIWNLERENTD